MYMASNGANGSDGAQSHGQIVQVIGPVVDVSFAEGEKLPDIYDALEIPLDDGNALVCEVQQQLPGGWVRSVAMSSTDGLRRGMPVIGTGAPIRVPGWAGQRWAASSTCWATRSTTGAGGRGRLLSDPPLGARP